MRFEPTPEGWLAVYPSEELVTWARDVRAIRDRTLENAYEYDGPDHRWAGHAGELLTVALLLQRGIVAHHSGEEGATDVVLVGEFELEVKVRGCNSRNRTTYHVTTKCAEPHDTGGLAFWAHERIDGRFVFLGTIGKRAFVDRADVVRAGERLPSGVVARTDNYVLGVMELTPPGVFLETLERRRYPGAA
jgi:hypothetical protein